MHVKKILSTGTNFCYISRSSVLYVYILKRIGSRCFPSVFLPTSLLCLSRIHLLHPCSVTTTHLLTACFFSPRPTPHASDDSCFSTYLMPGNRLLLLSTTVSCCFGWHLLQCLHHTFSALASSQIGLGAWSYSIKTYYGVAASCSTSSVIGGWRCWRWQSTRRDVG